MNIKTIPEKMIELSREDLFKQAMSYFSEPTKTQEQVLLEIINNAKNTEFGKAYDFDNISSINDFIKKVPLTTWEDYQQYSERMMEGEEHLIFNGEPKYFLRTSGTTGKNKFIPESAAGAAAKIAVTNLKNAAQLKTMATHMGNSFSIENLGHILTLASASSVSKTAKGIPVGTASGITSQNVPDIFKRLYAYPAAITMLSNQKTVDYLIMRFSIMNSDLIAVIGNNPSQFATLVQTAMDNAQEIIQDVRLGKISDKIELSADERDRSLQLLQPMPERADELQKILDSGRENFVAKNYWKNLKYGGFWLGSTVGFYLAQVKNYFPDDAVYFDIGYGASELKINVPIVPNTEFGPIADFAAFYEFIPEGKNDTVLIDELEDEKLYELVITTYSGLYRYRIGDFVMVNGKTANTPNIAFECKTGDTVSVVNEKISAALIVTAVDEAVKKLNCGSLIYCQVYPYMQEKSYQLFVELSSEEFDLDLLEKLNQYVDDALIEKSVSYDRYRHKGAINQCKVHIMSTGWQKSIYDAKLKAGQNKSQIKLPVVARSFPDDFEKLLRTK